MVPHISAVAMNIPEVQTATPPIEATRFVANRFAGSATEPSPVPVPSHEAVFANDASSPVTELIAQTEERSRASQADLDGEYERLLGSRTLRPADTFRLRRHVNIQSETLQLYKKVADQVTNGVQTLARGN
ncbi:hypothetical protein BX592_103387 [Paraburkholderia rhizosphaerae]|uniref:Uncharacterized protein n=2 Tax=Paraburkholderia rhizosphaerae TaxID=480658 RepID=A0A4R8LYV9_9BURK|nr:hypothetical protein BX592_103387 [Paraburkholderia rhizosphaerae]